jgi:hypothetical protein
MFLCEPSGYSQWAESSSTQPYSWGLLGYFLAQTKARATAQGAHPAAVTAATARVCALNPKNCSCDVTEAGPFESVQSTGFLSGTVTVTLRTEVNGNYTCDAVPEGATEYPTR